MASAFLTRSIALAGALTLAGCGTADRDASETVAAAEPDVPASNPSEPVVPAESPTLALPVDPQDAADCNVPQAAMFAGRRADSGVRAELAAAVAPVALIRWVGPGEPTTEDYRAQRLNVMLDLGGVIVSAHCG